MPSSNQQESGRRSSSSSLSSSSKPPQPLMPSPPPRVTLQAPSRLPGRSSPSSFINAAPLSSIGALWLSLSLASSGSLRACSDTGGRDRAAACCMMRSGLRSLAGIKWETAVKGSSWRELGAMPLPSDAYDDASAVNERCSDGAPKGRRKSRFPVFHFRSLFSKVFPH